MQQRVIRIYIQLLLRLSLDVRVTGAAKYIQQRQRDEFWPRSSWWLT